MDLAPSLTRLQIHILISIILQELERLSSSSDYQATNTVLILTSTNDGKRYVFQNRKSMLNTPLILTSNLQEVILGTEPRARMFRLRPDKGRTSPESESAQAISNLPDSHAESCRYFAPTKLADCSILRPIRENSLQNSLNSRGPSQKNSKVVDPRDTTQASGKQRGSAKKGKTRQEKGGLCPRCHQRFPISTVQVLSLWWRRSVHPGHHRQSPCPG